MLVGAALPALAVLAVADWVLRRHVPVQHAPDMHLASQTSSGSDDARAAKAVAATAGNDAPVPSSWVTSSTGAALQVLPGYVLAPVSAPSAASRQLVRGRPKLAALVSALAEQQAGLDEVDVLVAGGDGMTQQMIEFCAEFNMRRAANVPLLKARRMAFHN